MLKEWIFMLQDRCQLVAAAPPAPIAERSLAFPEPLIDMLRKEMWSGADDAVSARSQPEVSPPSPSSVPISDTTPSQLSNISSIPIAC